MGNALAELDVYSAVVTGGAFPAPNFGANGFFFKITEQTATITLPAFKDEDLEGIDEYTFALQEAPGYTIAEDAGSVTVNIIDDENSQIQVSFTTEPAVLIESEKTVSVHNFSLSATPPEEGLIVSVVAPNISEFDLSSIQTEGGEIARVTPTGFDFKITAKNAKIELPVADDGEDEGLEEAVFTLQDAPEYQVNPDAIVGTFQIVDTPDQAPALPVTEPNDTIEKALDTKLSATNNKVSFTSTIDFEFENSYEGPDGTTIYVDNSEDVDMYKVTLKAGDTIYIDTDSNQFDEGRKVDTWLRVFDASGTALASNDDGAAPDEIFESRFQSYIEFTAPADGDYYVGVTLYDNRRYDPNKPATGGAFSSLDPDDFGTGEYTLNINLNEPIVAAPTAIPRSDGTGPTISLFAVAGVYKDDFDNLDFNIQATGLAETIPEGSGSALNFVLTADGEIPEGGVEVFINSDVDLTQYFGNIEPGDYSVPYGGNLNSKPFTRGGQLLDAVYDATGRPTGFKFLLEESFATIVLNPSNRETPETDGSEDVTFSVVESKGYTTSDLSSSTVTFYDTVDQIPAPVTTPEVSLVLSTTELIESEETQITLTFSLSEPPPPEGVQIYVSGNAQDFLNEFAIFDAQFSGGVAVADGAVSGFYLQMFEQTATITLPVFNSTDIVEGIEEYNLAIRPGAGYTVNEAQNGGTLLIKDTPDAKIQVSLSTEPAVLIESEQTVSVHNFSLSATPPEEGVTVTVSAPNLSEFDLDGIAVEGGEIVNVRADGFDFKITARDAKISLPVANDGNEEGVKEATFTVEAGESYQVNLDASSATFTIVDVPEQAPGSTDEANDTLETAIATGLGGNTLSVSFEGEIAEHPIEVEPGEEITIDGTEDVDLYKVDLLTGQKLTIDLDSLDPDPEQAGATRLQYAQLRVFDAAGNEVAKTSFDDFQAAPDELFQVFNDPYLQFTAPAAGTYYVGVSQIGNDYYNPNQIGSGSGWIFPDFDIGVGGKYALNLDITPV
ncbi:MAG: DVUA0089 family protein [Synechococcales cyanobacterium M58_A2018_015]|nr:DVUA0089 family protein [Synechococcales cyanobacterium M58_A2018_015]